MVSGGTSSAINPDYATSRTATAIHNSYVSPVYNFGSSFSKRLSW